MASMLRITALALIPLSGCVSPDTAGTYARVSELARVERAEDPAARTRELLADGIAAGEVAELALLNHPEARLAYLEAGIADAEGAEAAVIANPSFGGALRFVEGGGLPALEIDLMQSLSDILTQPARKRAAAAGTEQATLLAARTLYGIAIRARESYTRVMISALVLDTERDNLETARALHEIALARQEAGAGNAADTYLAHGRVYAKELDVREAERSHRQARAALAQALGFSDPGTVVIADRRLAWTAPAELLSAGRALDVALANRLDLRAAESAIARADELVEVEGSFYRPVFSAGASLERSEEHDYSLGPAWEVEIPLFDQNQAGRARARLAAEQARTLRDLILLGVKHGVTVALDDVKAGSENLSFYRNEVLPLEVQSLSVAIESFRAGRTDIAAVLEAQRSMVEARLRAIQLEREMFEGLYRLEEALGIRIDQLSSEVGHE